MDGKTLPYIALETKHGFVQYVHVIRHNSELIQLSQLVHVSESKCNIGHKHTCPETEQVKVKKGTVVPVLD
jgi:hypothetical protein